MSKSRSTTLACHETVLTSLSLSGEDNKELILLRAIRDSRGSGRTIRVWHAMTGPVERTAGASNYHHLFTVITGGVRVCGKEGHRGERSLLNVDDASRTRMVKRTEL